MLKIITLNLNGIRASAKKGAFHWLSQQQADVICFQEVRCHASQLQDKFRLAGYTSYFRHAEKGGYSGVGIYTKRQPDNISYRLGWDLPNKEGRYLQLDFKNLSIASIYIPSGTSGEERQQCKFDFMKRYQAILKQQLGDKRQYILCGDWNIAHQAIDLKNWKANQNSSGFLPEEREWMSNIFSMGYIDAFRTLEPAPNHYTWWSYRGGGWKNNAGWRIDYQIISPNLKGALRTAHIYTKERFSDHAPLTVEYDIIPK